MVGTTIRCPRCLHTFAVALNSEILIREATPPLVFPLPTEEAASTSRHIFVPATRPTDTEHARPNLGPAWNSVQRGLDSLIWGNAILAIDYLGVGMVILLLEAGGAAHISSALGLLCCFGFAGLIGVLVDLNGLLLCSAVPDGQAKAFMLAPVLCVIGSVLLFCVGVSSPIERTLHYSLFEAAFAGLALGTVVMFVFFLKRVCDLLGDVNLARSCRNCLFAIVGLALLQVLLLGSTRVMKQNVAGAFQGVGPDAFDKLSIVTTSSAFFGSLACVVWILILLHRTSAMVDNALRSSGVHR
jgi:hypothetical protein